MDPLTLTLSRQGRGMISKEQLKGLEEHMTKEDLLAILKKVLRTERSLDFLNGLDEEDVRTLIVCIRDRLDRENRDH
jgi:hypothetical protein